MSKSNIEPTIPVVAQSHSRDGTGPSRKNQRIAPRGDELIRCTTSAIYLWSFKSILNEMASHAPRTGHIEFKYLSGLLCATDIAAGTDPG